MQISTSKLQEQDVEDIFTALIHCISLKGLDNGHIVKTLNENDSQ